MCISRSAQPDREPRRRHQRLVRLRRCWCARIEWTLSGGILLNLVAFAICLPLVQRFRAAKMPLITRRWYDIPLRAALVATLVATVVTLSNAVGPNVSAASSRCFRWCSPA